MAQLINTWQRNLNPSCLTPEYKFLMVMLHCLWYVWIICWHLKVKRGKIKIQIYSLSEWKISSYNNHKLTLPQGNSQPPLRGDAFFGFPQFPPFPAAFQHRGRQSLAVCHQANTVVSVHTALFTHVCDLSGPCGHLWPSTRLLLKTICPFALTHILGLAEICEALASLMNCY